MSKPNSEESPTKPVIPITQQSQLSKTSTVESAEMSIYASNEEIGFIRALGAGGFSKVFLSLDSGKSVARKRITHDKTSAAYAQREVRFLEVLQPHPHIIRLLHVNVTEDFTELTLDSFEFDLYEYLMNNQPNYGRKISFIPQVLEVITYCHSKNIRHRDVKPGKQYVTNRQHSSK